MPLKKERIGFIGAGSMAEALLGGLLGAGVRAEQLRASDPDPARREHVARELGVDAGADNAQLVRSSSVVVLAVKPHVLPAVLADLPDGDEKSRPLWISIAAGVTLASLEAGLSPNARIVRAMPNTPALVQAGATGLCGNARAGAGDLALATALFAGVGIAWEAPSEPLLDAVTGLSGSGPAYVFLFLEALIEAGASQGLPREVAERLAFQTVYGAAKLARGSPRSPAELRRQVGTPGGTTVAGLERLEAAGFAEAIGEAVAAATRRAAELGRGE